MQITTERLSQVLFERDPMNTACKENDVFDEYNLIAASTIDLMERGISFDEALHQVISEMFFEEMADDVDYSGIKDNLKPNKEFNSDK